jgi:hypothetical protein
VLNEGNVLFLFTKNIKILGGIHVHEQ